MQSYIKNEKHYDKKAKAFPLNKKDCCFIIQPEADHQGSKTSFRVLFWIGPYLVKEIPNNNCIVRKLQTNGPQILHSIRLRNYNPQEPLKAIFRKPTGRLTIISTSRKTIHIPLNGKQKLEKRLLDIPITYTDPIANDFDESQRQGPDTVLVPRFYFHHSSDGKNRETCSTLDPSVVHPSNPKSHGQSHDHETATDLRFTDSSKQTSESSTDAESAHEPIQHPLSRQKDPTSKVESNKPIIENISQNKSGQSRGGKCNLHANPNPKYSDKQILKCAGSKFGHFVVPFLFSVLFNSFIFFFLL